jgi:hypothetical protein
MRPAGVAVKYTAVGPASNVGLQVHRFNFSDESLVVVGEERTDHIEYGVTEATDVDDVSSLTSLNRLVRLRIDVDSLRASFLSCLFASVGNDGFSVIQI